jgi:hypothetical protein
MAHRKAAPIFAEMARSRDVLFDIIRKNLGNPDYLRQSRINPVIAMSIGKSDIYEFIFHGWLPLPDRSTAVSHQSIHHHGNLLLTSVSPFGPGYDSILFKQGIEIDPTTEVAKLHVAKYYRNGFQNLEFVETDTAHIVFYPPEFSITYAFWTTDRAPAKLVSAGKGMNFLRQYKKPIKKALEFVGLSKSLGLNTTRYLDYYLDGDVIRAMKDRVMYPVGTHANFVQNVFHILQKIGFDDSHFIRNLPDSTPEVAQWKAAFLRGDRIDDLFDPVHLNIPKVNISRAGLVSHFRLGEITLSSPQHQIAAE